MSNILQSIGLGDGQGNTSSMRVIALLVVLAVLAPAVYLAFSTHTSLALTTQDLGVIGIALGAKCVQNQQENQAPVTPVAPKP